MNLLKLSLVTATLIVGPIAAQAQVDGYRYIGKCHFEAPDQEQGDDCNAHWIICPMTSTPTMGECTSMLKVRCGNRTVFKGLATATSVDSSGVVSGIPNGSYPEAPSISFPIPTSFPAKVASTLTVDSSEQAGTCRIKRIAPVYPTPPPVPGVDIVD